MENNNTKSVIRRVFDAKDEELDNVISFVEDELTANDCNLKTQLKMLIVVEEVFVNIAHYAYPESEGQAVISMSFEEDDVTITFEDEGIEFDPLQKEDPDITADAEHRDIGGLGIYMTKTVMDSVSYSRVDGKNILTLRKKIH